MQLKRALLAAGVVLWGCGGTTGSSPTGEAAGQWYAGDFHVHTSVASSDTRYPDGHVESFPETIRRVAIERGMSFVVLTDHSNAAGSRVDTQVEDGRLWNHGPEFPLWDTAAQLSTRDFLLIDGTEFSPVSNLDANQCENCQPPALGSLPP